MTAATPLRAPSAVREPIEASGGVGGLLQQFTVPVGSSGMRLLHTALVNAVLTPDGRAFVGAVRPAALEHVAATTAH